MFVGDRHAFRLGFERRIDPGFLDHAIGDGEADFVGLVAGGDGGGEIEEIGSPACSVPCAALVPCPPVKARIKPVVTPLAAAMYWVSVISITQVPLPMGMPAIETA